MKIRKSAVLGTAVIGAHIGHGQPSLVSAMDLQPFGVDARLVAEEFHRQTGVQIELNQLLKVSSEDEGQNLRFETLDNISITVPIEYAAGPLNKTGIGSER